METLEAVEKKITPQKKFLWYPKTQNDESLSEIFGVLPLNKNEVVRYKLIESDKIDPTRTEVVDRVETLKFLKKTPGYTMVGKKEIFDPILGKTVTIMNKSVRGEIKGPGGAVIRTSKPESVKFLSDKPVVTVRWTEPEKYAFMERADENIDNPLRDPNAPAKYYRIDPRKKIEKEEEKGAFEYRAIKWVMEAAKYDQLVLCAVHMNKVDPKLKLKTDYKNNEMSDGFSILKKQLFDLAKIDPKNILKGSEDKGAMFEMQMRDAEKLGLIMFVDGKDIRMSGKEQTWFHNDETLSSICLVPPGKNKYEALFEFFTGKDEKGAAHYQKMVEALKKVLTPR
jgi:hypothetical protein